MVRLAQGCCHLILCNGPPQATPPTTHLRSLPLRCSPVPYHSSLADHIKQAKRATSLTETPLTSMAHMADRLVGQTLLSLKWPLSASVTLRSSSSEIVCDTGGYERHKDVVATARWVCHRWERRGFSTGWDTWYENHTERIRQASPPPTHLNLHSLMSSHGFS